MVELVCDPAGRDCHWVIRPNQSLSWRQAIQVYVAVAIVCLGIGIAFALYGFWTVLPFAGLEVLVLGGAFYLCLTRSQIREVVTVNASTVAVEKGRQTPEERWECPRAWARISLEQPQIAWYPSRLAITFQGRQVQLGAFLNEDERRALAAGLQQVIHRDGWQQDSKALGNPAP
ncbi:MAG TPA: DUF2244 domain-containing protein [Gammaproteobacteria bacterium]|nr:DUF2244 domain-containing protein [Gammaproteobacteria bacterium]